jgi:4-azaleucine resistance transporter AzlC
MTPAPPAPTRPGEFWAGVRAISPLVIGVIPFAVIFGAVAVTGGLSTAAAAAMSAIVFAGSSQFIAAGMVAAGASPLVIVATTFVVNLRHALYSVTLSPHVRGLPQRWLLPLGFLLTDEAFAVTIRRYTQPDPSPLKHWFYLGAGLTLYVNWQAFTWIGLWAGLTIADPGAWGLGFALPLTFIALLIPQLVNRSVLICVATAGTAALLFGGLPHQTGLIAAALAGVIAGVAADRVWPTRAVRPPAQECL